MSQVLYVEACLYHPDPMRSSWCSLQSILFHIHWNTQRICFNVTGRNSFNFPPLGRAVFVNFILPSRQNEYKRCQSHTNRFKLQWNCTALARQSAQEYSCVRAHLFNRLLIAQLPECRIKTFYRSLTVRKLCLF